MNRHGKETGKRLKDTAFWQKGKLDIDLRSRFRLNWSLSSNWEYDKAAKRFANYKTFKKKFPAPVIHHGNQVYSFFCCFAPYCHSRMRDLEYQTFDLNSKPFRKQLTEVIN